MEGDASSHDSNRGNTNFNGPLTSTLEDESYTSEMLKELFQEAVDALELSTKLAATKSGCESDLSKQLSNTQDHQHRFPPQEERIHFARDLNIFTDYRVSPPLEEIDILDKTRSDSKKRKIQEESRHRSKAIVKKIDNTLGAERPFPHGTLDEKGWKVFFTILKKFESEGSIDCKRLWNYKRYDEVFRVIHCILKAMMLQNTKNKQYLDESEIINMRYVFGIWYRLTFKERGPFPVIGKGIRKGKGWMFSDEEVNALDVGMYMYPADTTQKRFDCIRYDTKCGPIFQNTR